MKMEKNNSCEEIEDAEVGCRSRRLGENFWRIS
jgi:hypothetical protein